MYSAASPEKGGVNERIAPPVVVPPLIVSPVLGLNHSTFSAPDAAVRFTLIAPLVADRYVRYSPSVGEEFARQKFVDESAFCGVIAARLIRREYLTMYPKFFLNFSTAGLAESPGDHG